MKSSPRTAGLIKLPNYPGNTCFGCGPSNDRGLHMEFYADRQRVLSYLMIPEHLCGWNSIAHGGAVSTILDEIMSWSAIYLARSVILTKSMSVDFLKPVRINDDIMAEGVISRSISEREVEIAGAIYNSSNEICAKSLGLFALFPSDVLHRKGILAEDMIDFLESIIKMNK
jgi:acyl-coenzyme A thioesterase PaaI-like protein